MAFASNAPIDRKLRNSVQHNLTAYTLAAGATGVGLLATLPTAAAQIVYTPATAGIGLGQKIRIDFNHDGLTDLIISEVRYESRGNSGNSLKALPHSGGGVKQGYGEEFAQALSRGARIGPTGFFLPKKAIIEQTYSIYYQGSWLNQGVHYLGVRFPINGQMHYGWVRLEVTWGIDGEMDGFAYETRPDTPINAGQTGSEQEAQSASEGSLEPRPVAEMSLGALALGTQGLGIWRRFQP
jgi:hypothetical protein